MATDIVMPSYSDNMEEADLIGWLVSPGDFIDQGDPIAEIETDKATGELESPFSGTLVEICVPEGTTGVKVGSVVARLEISEKLPENDLGKASRSPGRVHSPPIEPEVESVAEQGMPPEPTVTALARRVAKQSGLDLARLHGTGSHGRITRADVDAAAAGPPGHAAGTDRGVLDVQCDVGKALDVCQQATGREPDGEINLLCFAIRAAALALQEVPEVSARSADSDAGLLLRAQPVGQAPRLLRGAERKSLAVLAHELRDESNETGEEPALEIFDFQALGIHRVQTSTPEGPALSLGMGAARTTDPGGPLVYTTFTLSVDTRKTDLAVAARWFAEFCRRIENPLEMLL